MRDYIKKHKLGEKYNLSKFQQGGLIKRGEEQPSIQPARNPIKQFLLNAAGG